MILSKLRANYIAGAHQEVNGGMGDAAKINCMFDKLNITNKLLFVVKHSVDKCYLVPIC